MHPPFKEAPVKYLDFLSAGRRDVLLASTTKGLVLYEYKGYIDEVDLAIT